MNPENDENPPVCEIDRQSGRPSCCGPGDLSTIATPVTRDLPPAKQTSLGLYVTAKEAHEKWKADPGAVMILDVRTPEEYIYVGHSEMAVNIPLAFQSYRWNAEKGYFDYEINKDFVAQVKTWADPGDTILVTCRSGGRSAMAVNILAKAGFTQTWNITDGMEGDADADSKRTVNGWKNSVPWTYKVNPAQVLLPDTRAEGE